MAKPEVPQISRWTGTMLFKVVAFTRAGIIESVDFGLPAAEADAAVADALRISIVRAMGRYKCEGDSYFEQEFKFSIR